MLNEHFCVLLDAWTCRKGRKSTSCTTVQAGRSLPLVRIFRHSSMIRLKTHTVAGHVRAGVSTVLVENLIVRQIDVMVSTRCVRYNIKINTFFI